MIIKIDDPTETHEIDDNKLTLLSVGVTDYDLFVGKSLSDNYRLVVFMAELNTGEHTWVATISAKDDVATTLEECVLDRFGIDPDLDDLSASDELVEQIWELIFEAADDNYCDFEHFSARDILA